MRLNSEQLGFFKREGYLVVPNALDPAGLQPAIDEITEAIDVHASEAVALGKLSHTYADEPFETRLWKIHQEYEDLYWSVMYGQLQGHGIFALVSNEELLDLAESVVGARNHRIGGVPAASKDARPLAWGSALASGLGLL